MVDDELPAESISEIHPHLLVIKGITAGASGEGAFAAEEHLRPSHAPNEKISDAG